MSEMKIAFDAKRAFYNGTGLGDYSRFVINNLVQYAPDNCYQLFTPGLGNARLRAQLTPHASSHTCPPQPSTDRPLPA